MLQEINFLGRKVGHYDRERHIYISYREERHIFRKFNGLGISTKVLNMLYKNGCKLIIIFLNRKEKLERFDVPFMRFFNSTTIYTDKLDYQKILSFSELKGG